MPGWKTSIAAVRKFEDLPQNAQNYVHKIEELLGMILSFSLGSFFISSFLGIPMRWVGVGPERESMILRPDA